MRTDEHRHVNNEHRHSVDGETHDVRLVLGITNARSVCNKCLEVRELTLDSALDVLCITETWLHGDIRDDPIITELTPDGFKFEHVPRMTRGGGVGVLLRDELSATNRTKWEMQSMECLDMTLPTKPPTRLITVYRPPLSSFGTFLSEMDNLMSAVIMCGGHLVVTGDFNAHVDTAALNTDAHAFVQLMDSYGLDQLVQNSTHIAGHTLDLIFIRSPADISPVVEVIDVCLSDHMLVKCCLQLPKPSKPRRKISYRRIKAIDRETFKADIRESDLCTVQYQSSTADLCAEDYFSVMSDIVDRHAPLSNIVIPDRQCVWYNSDIRAVKQTRRAAERRWRKSGLQVDKLQFIEKKKQVMQMMNRARSEFYSTTISENIHDSKKLFAVTAFLMGKKKQNVLPTGTSNADLATQFSDYFANKIEDIRASIIPDGNPLELVVQSPVLLVSWSSPTPEEVADIIRKAPNKSCPLDPLPTSLLKECLDDLLPCITDLMKQSLESGTVPMMFKMARVVPTLKKAKLDPEKMSSYRPVSNLSFLSKVLEKLVVKRLMAHLQDNDIEELMQSAYRAQHSTETALIRVHHDLVTALSARRPSVVCLIDLSAAFDTVDHTILLKILEKYGLRDIPLKWFESYLGRRQQMVSVGNACSTPKQLDSGVPQGSVLGPVLFNVYTKALGDLLRQHSMNFHIYADDTTVYLSFEPDDVESAFSRMERCLSDIKRWMNTMRLKMNSDKTELMVVTTRRGAIDNVPVIFIDDQEAKTSKMARLLGVLLDEHLDLDKHVQSMCRSAWYHLKNISRIRRCLPDEACERLIHAFITTKIDYCNGLLYALPKKTILKIQRVQNGAARILKRVPGRNHITPVLRELHWLPVQARIEYKIILTAFKCIHGFAPKYLDELIEVRDPPRPGMRSSAAPMLTSALGRNVHMTRSFGFSAPCLWNSLPETIRQVQSLMIFKNQLKTFLYRKFYQ